MSPEERRIARRLGRMEERIRAYMLEHPSCGSNRELARAVGGLDRFGALTVEFIVAWDSLVIELHQRHLNG